MTGKNLVTAAALNDAALPLACHAKERLKAPAVLTKRSCARHVPAAGDLLEWFVQLSRNVQVALFAEGGFHLRR